MTERQVARATDSGHVNQAGRDMFLVMGDDAIVNALTRVFRDNPDLLDAATARVVQERAEEITHRVVDILRDDESLKANLAEPKVRRDILRAQTEYATYGDETLRDVHVGLLAESLRNPARDLTALAVSKAIETASQLLPSHMKLVAALFYLRHVNVVSSELGLVKDLMTQALASLPDGVVADYDTVRYIESTGCGVYDTTGQWTLDFSIYNTRFSDELQAWWQSLPEKPTSPGMTGLMGSYVCSETPGICNLLEEISKEIPPSGSLRSFVLSNVGKAIGHAYLTQNRLMVTTSLSIWID